MPASAPFRAKSPFKARIIGVNYHAFGLDFINPPYRSITGELSVTPTSDYSVTGGCGGTYLPAATTVYTLTNTGRAAIGWSALSNVTWMTLDKTSGSLNATESVQVTATLSPAGLAQSGIPYSGKLTFSNTTNGIGNESVNLQLFQGYAVVPQDDFESYPIGTITTLDGGSCWDANGSFILQPAYYSYDDFEAYAIGPVTTLQYGSSWLASGFFMSGYLYPSAYDDFESYSIGSITALTFSNSTTQWAANGTFLSYP